MPRTGLAAALALCFAWAAQAAEPRPIQTSTCVPARPAGAQAEAAIVLIDPADETATLAIDAVVELRLSEQLGTGYRWMLDGADALAPTVVVESEAEIVCDAGEGGSSWRVFRLRAAVAGEVRASFAYRRPFGSPEPAKSAQLLVVVSSP